MTSLVRLTLPVSHLLARPSPTARRLVALAEVLELKALPPPAWLPTGPPRVFHWGLGLVEAEFAPAFEPVGRWLAANRPELFSCDLGPAAARRLGLTPLSPILSRPALEKRAAQALALIRKAHSGPVAVENYNYYPTGLYEHVCRPDYLAAFLEKFDLGLVLDLAHAAVSASNLGLTPEAYLAEMPFERVWEIHLSRPRLPADPRALAADAHLRPGPRELSWLKLTLERLPAGAAPPLAAIEHYQSLAGLLKATLELQAFLTAL
jgi:hypothetical protein